MDMGVSGAVLITLILYIVQGIIFGVAVNVIIENKGYHDNWFGWGFFFGFIALIVALSKPQKAYEPAEENLLLKKSQEQYDLNNGGWKCGFCNSINAYNVTTCSCGKGREESERKGKEEKASAGSGAAEEADSSLVKDELHIVEVISQYKNLLDSGAITQEEFDRKKQSLLQK